MTTAARSDNARSGLVAAALYRNPLLLWLTLLLTVVGGLAAFDQLPRLEDPHITQRNAQITTLLPGATARRVEALVTEPLEELLEEIAEIKTVESTSRSNVSLISLELEDTVDATTNTDVFAEIRARLRDAQGLLPAEATSPTLDDKRGAIAFGAIVAVSWRDGEQDRALGTLGRMAERLGDRLRRMNGTELVRYYGAPEEEITVVADPAAVAAAGLSISDFARLVAGADAKTSAGRLRSAARELPLELAGELDGVQRIRRVPLQSAPAGEAGLLTVGDVAQVTRGWREPPRDVTLHEARRTVLVAARPVVSQRVDLWGAQMRDTVAAFAREAGGQFDIEVVFDQSRYVDARLSNLSGNLFAGVAVVMALVLLIMGWRAALVIGLALPLSFAVALFGLAVFGLQLHQMTIFGLLVAMGLLIDNAIVVTDEVQHRLEAHGERERAVREAVAHLFGPLWTSTLTTVLGFMPIFLLNGNIGDFVGPIAVSVILALLASFAFSVTSIPVLAARYLPATPDAPAGARAASDMTTGAPATSRRTPDVTATAPIAGAPADADRAARARAGVGGRRHRWWRDGLRLPVLGAGYRTLLTTALRRPLVTVAVCLAFPIAGFLAVTRLGLEFFPPADRDQFEVEVWRSADTALAAMEDTARAIDTVVREEDGVAGIDWRIGGNFPTVYYNVVMRRDDTPYYAHAIVTADSVAAAARLVPRLQQRLDQRFADARIVVSAFGQGPPSEAPVAFRLYGPDTDALARYGEQVRRIMHEVPGLLHSSASIRGGQLKLRVGVDEYAAARSGLTLVDVASQMQTSLDGRVGGSVLEDTENLPVRVRVPDAWRADAGRIADLRLLSAQSARRGDWIPASALGELSLVPEKAAVTRRNGERVNNLYGYTADGVLPIEVTREIGRRVAAEVVLPPGYRLEVAGESESQQEAVGGLAAYAPVLGLAMATTVILAFSSVVLGGLIGVVAVLCVGLGMLCLFLAGFPLGFNPLIGSAGLIGVAINGSIVVLAALRDDARARAGHLASMVDVVTRSTRHLLATSLTTSAGFGPLLLAGGSFWPPLAIVIAGGVALSLMLSIGFTPACYRLLCARRAARDRRGSAVPAPRPGSDLTEVTA